MEKGEAIMQHRFTKEEQDEVRKINMATFFIKYNEFCTTERFYMNNKGYICDKENPKWVCNAARNWWYDNSENATRKNGNLIDWLMYLSGWSYSFPETMNILLAYTRGEEWWKGLRGNGNSFDYLKPEELPFN